MKCLLLVSCMFITFYCLSAQKENSEETIIAAAGDRTPIMSTNKLGSNNAMNGKPLLDAVHEMFQAYKPSVIQGRPYFSMVPATHGRSANPFTYTIMAHEYDCSSIDNQLTVADETSTSINVLLNAFYETELYDTSKGDYLTGYFQLRHGLPVEVKPDIWQFPGDKVPIRFGNSGNSNIWLFTFDGELSTTTGSKSSDNPFILSGKLSAPSGTQTTLSCVGNDIAVSIPKDKKLSYTTIPFSFPKPLQKNTPYEVKVKTLPANLKAVVYNGKGQFQTGSNKVRIGADYNYELLTRSSDDKVLSTFYQSGDVAIGGYKGEEGRYVAFISLTEGIEGSNGKFRQIFWRDRNTGTTKLISASSAGVQGNGDSYLPSLSADGQLVVFESNASNLAEGDNNNAKDIFLWNALTNKIELVSKSSSGGFADAESMDAAISGNGQYVVFTSTAGNLSSISKGQSITNVFVRDLQASKTDMISIDPLKLSGANGGKGSISFNGDFVSFCSPTNALVPGDNNGLWDIFLWQKDHKGLQRISVTFEGKDHDQGQESATRMIASSISGNGRYVAYSTTSGNIVPNDNNNLQDVFVYDTETGKVIIASQTDEGKPSDGDSPIEQGEKVAISYEGTWVAFPTKATNLGTPGSNIVLHNMITGKKQIVTSTKGSYVGRPAISYSGSYIVFGKSEAMDNRFSASGMFAHFTGNGPCRDCKE